MTTPQIEISEFSAKLILFKPEAKKDWFFSFTNVLTTNSSLTLAITVEKFFPQTLLYTEISQEG